VPVSLAYSVAEKNQQSHLTSETSLPVPLVALHTDSSSAHRVRVSTVLVYGVASSSHSAVHYGHGACRVKCWYYSSARCVVVLWSRELVPASSSHVLTCLPYLICRFRLELDLHGLISFSITGGVLYVWSICCCCAWPCPRMSAREQESGSSRAFDTVL
jgi:hypothetical protein